MILTGTGHTVLYLGMVGGKHYIIHAPKVGREVVVEEISETDLAKWSNYTIFAPNNYLEEAPLRKLVSTTGATFTATIETPAYGTYDSSKKYTLNDSLHAEESTLLDKNSYADKYVLNAGGRDIYVWAVFERIQSEVAAEVQYVIPDGFGILNPFAYAGITYSSGHTNSTNVFAQNSGSTKNIRLTVFKGYKLVEIKTSGGVTTSTGISVSAENNNGAVINYTDTFNGSTISQNGPVYPSYTGVALNTYGTTDGGITYVIQPTSYEVVYDSNYPSDYSTSTKTVTGTHYYNCTGNAVNSTAVFTKGDGTGVDYSETYEFKTNAHYKFLGWSKVKNSCISYRPDKDYSYETEVINQVTTGEQDATWTVYAVWAPIKYTLSVEFVSQVDRELIGTPEGFCVKVGDATIKKNQSATTAAATISFANRGSVTTNCSASYANNILSITTTAAGESYFSVDSLSVNILENKYMAVTYKLSGGASANNYMTFLTGLPGSSYTNSTATYTTNCVKPGWVADGKWHTAVFNMADMTTFYGNNKTLKGIQIPGSTVKGGVLDIKSICFYSTPPTLWGDSKETESTVGTSTALKTQGNYTFNHVLNASTSVNVVSAQQADYDFVMDLTEAYLFFYDANRNIVTNSTWDSKFGANKSITVNGVTQNGYDVSGLIQNHTFDMSSKNFTMPGYHAKLVFVCDYMHYSVKVFTYTTGTSYGTIGSDYVENNATSTPLTSIGNGKVQILSSKNDGIVGRYGSTVVLKAEPASSSHIFLGWYEKTEGVNDSYGKLLSAEKTFELSENLHKDMEIVAVFGASASTNTIFNFRNVAGQVIQTLVASKNTYIPVTNITAKPFKSCSVFTGWEFLKHVDKSGAETHSYNNKTYYLVDGTSQYGYSVLYSDAICTEPAYIYVTGDGGDTVNIDGSYTTLTTGNVQITVQGEGTINGSEDPATVPYNTTVTAVATGTSAFKGWVDMTNPSTRYTPESYKSGSYYYPYISYSETFKFKAIKAMTIMPIYASAAAADKKPNVSITPVIQKTAETSGSKNYYKYTAYGMFTANPGTTYQILEWGALFYATADANDVPTTTSYNSTTGMMETKNILTTDSYVANKFAKVANSYSIDANPAGQYGASIRVQSAKTIYVRMYCRYSYTDSTTNETVYVVTYSDTYTFNSTEYDEDIAGGYEAPTPWNGDDDLNPDDFDGGLF